MGTWAIGGEGLDGGLYFVGRNLLYDMKWENNMNCVHIILISIVVTAYKSVESEVKVNSH
jgi:hypothetical protein